MLAAHCYTQQREHVWMTETSPRHYFPAEPLGQHDQHPDTRYWKV